MLNLKNIAIDESDDGLDWAWLDLSYEERLRLHWQILQRGIKLEEAIKGIVIPQHVDKTVRYSIVKDAF
jgi:hypothetical protein